MRMKYTFILAVIITISQYSNCRKLGGEGHHHNHDHSEHHHDHSQDHQHDHGEHHHHDNHNHVDHEQEIQALESSIESVYASFDGSEDIDNVYPGSLEETSFPDISYNVIDDDGLEELDRSRYSLVVSTVVFKFILRLSTLGRSPLLWRTAR